MENGVQKVKRVLPDLAAAIKEIVPNDAWDIAHACSL